MAGHLAWPNIIEEDLGFNSDYYDGGTHRYDENQLFHEDPQALAGGTGTI